MRRIALFALVAACGSATPIVPTPPAQLPPLDDIVKACAFEVSCLVDPPTSSLSNCVAYFQGGIANYIGGGFSPLEGSEYRRFADCAAAANNCMTVLECASRNHDPAYCAAHPNNSCDGSVLVQCGTAADWSIYTTDCAAFGLRCQQANGAAACTDGAPCDPTSTPLHCAGNQYVSCDKTTGLRSTVDCNQSPIPNATCRIGASVAFFSNPPGCLPSGPPCVQTPRCDGNLLVTCVAGEETRIDCGQLASHCAATGDYEDPITCVSDDTQCDGGASCAGDAIVACVDGAWTAIPCSMLGLTSCAVVNGTTLCQ